MLRLLQMLISVGHTAIRFVRNHMKRAASDLTRQAEPRISEFNQFLKIDLKKALVKAAKNHIILSEADLQSLCFILISRWVGKRDSLGIFKTVNKPFLADCRKYPDIAVLLRKNRPWALIELKEQR